MFLEICNKLIGTVFCQIIKDIPVLKVVRLNRTGVTEKNAITSSVSNCVFCFLFILLSGGKCRLIVCWC